MQPLGLLPLVLLLRKLKEGQKKLTDTTADGSQVASCCPGVRRTNPRYLFDLLSVLGGAARGVDAKALLEHGHPGLGLAALDLRQPVPLLLLPGFQVLDHPLVVALHLFLLLKPRVIRRERQ